MDVLLTYFLRIVLTYLTWNKSRGGSRGRVNIFTRNSTSPNLTKFTLESSWLLSTCFLGSCDYNYLYEPRLVYRCLSSDLTLPSFVEIAYGNKNERVESPSTKTKVWRRKDGLNSLLRRLYSQTTVKP